MGRLPPPQHGLGRPNRHTRRAGWFHIQLIWPTDQEEATAALLLSYLYRTGHRPHIVFLELTLKPFGNNADSRCSTSMARYFLRSSAVSLISMTRWQCFPDFHLPSPENDCTNIGMTDRKLGNAQVTHTIGSFERTRVLVSWLV